MLQRCRGIVAVQPATARARMATIAEIDRLMAAAHLKLGETGQAIEVSAGAIDGDPDNPELYRQYAQALETAGKRQEAIAVLMQGVMLTMNAGLRQNVVQAYQQGVEGGGCALMRGQNGSMALNPRCEVVKEALCVGTAAAMRVRAKAGLPNVVEDLRKTGIRDFGCTPAALGGQ